MSVLASMPLEGGAPVAGGAIVADARTVDKPATVAFTSDNESFFGLLARGAFFELVTFGFYRFWLATAIRRHLWSATRLGGEALEYSGEGRELLIGFLIALAVLGPVFLLNFLVGLYAESLKAFLSLPLALFYYAFSQFALYRARRYRLTRTIWRGVRFWMTGSGWSYALRAFLWSMFTTVTLGLAYPWRAAALERYKLRNTYYGDLQGAFVERGSALFKQIWWFWVVAVLPFLALAGAFAALVVRELQAGHTELEGLGQSWIGPAFVLWAVVALLCLPVLRAAEWRWWASGIRFGGLALSSRLHRGALIVLYVQTVGAAIGIAVVMTIILTLVGLGIAAATGFPVFQLRLAAPETLARYGYIVFAISMVYYLLIALAVLTVQRFYMQHEFWRKITGSLTVSGLAAAATVAARGAAANALGEGLADGLDVAGF